VNDKDDEMDAAGYLDRADTFLPSPALPADLAEPFLHGISIAIELATKAAMKHGGATEDDCIEARHDLEAGIAAAEARGFVSDDNLHELARQLSPWYRTHRLGSLIDGGYTFDQTSLHQIVSRHIARIDAWMKDTPA
jgi:hypothetical protein